MDNHELERRVRAIETRLERHDIEIAAAREQRDRFLPVIEELARAAFVEKELHKRGLSRAEHWLAWLGLLALVAGQAVTLYVTVQTAGTG